jgi:choline dehydrogenase/5-(hydroxymethyl)furfural/furfural oxidase
MVALPGLPADYDRWAALGATGWGWRDVAPWFNRRLVPASAVPEETWAPCSVAFREAAAALGHLRSTDAISDGVSAARLTMAGGRRVSVNDRYLEPARGRPNLTVRGGSLVDRVLLQGRTAVGVRLADGTEIEAGEVVLAAGAIHTPAILLRSGVDRAGIGANLKDHPSAQAVVQLETSGRAPHSTVEAVQCLLRWSSGAAEADLQMVPTNVLGADDAALSAAMLMVAVMQVHAAGQVRLASEDPTVEPIVDFDLLGDERDLVRLRWGFRHLLEVLRQPSITAITSEVVLDDEGTSAEELDADDAIDAWLLAHTGDYAHACGTCRMGDASDPTAVVDPRGKVIGYEGLRVVDASIMPDLPRANIHLTTVMIGERIGTMIREETA